MKKLFLSLAACCAVLGATSAAQASDTLTKIRESGIVVLGVRDGAPPLSYTNGGDNYAGYHVELCQRILAGIQRDLNLPKFTTKFQVVTSTNRIPLVQNGTVDIECGTTTNNLARQEQVAFALTTYVTEIRMVVKAISGIHSMSQLKGRPVATTAGSTGGKALRIYRRSTGLDVNELVSKDHAESFLLLESGRADAFVIDDNIAAGNISMAKNPDEYRLTGEVLSVEPIALMMRKDDPGFKKAVDDQIRKLMLSGEFAKLYDKWFVQPIPPKGIAVNLPMGSTLKNLISSPNDKAAETYEKM
ncbi:amino acid ABC transporter substrate-binding protein [Verminephrobacter aporrectodeae subsp. tuberculatae]|uniref:Amino acid ABC transporter substrate-binding protein n=1 Tax=Verminephrobacter aporrectodeae subsp. tuberculatae TaxID=1110392 RepID=A0ABT3KNC9_9BURK|nr:amino acid ABC transporter substrate-binding protein [Verminephrobacter aporrectodeae]MCW5319830.1 amino acid ABC transporter substrate-binding protein [Verminephrobacter aporrectodeae subsp. tuberculatae]MCW8166265.1 amino acid ABC transporter substrate-binding protein [Verminephrobacter aporrectodeae subsp. tuberculatae]MCW8170303.1 amino acid ABC transporter substrate-binding protein [Verminephrobacter aporrectodeae subsp. tuberculatae]